MEEDLTLTPGRLSLKRGASLKDCPTLNCCQFPYKKLSSTHADVLIRLCSFDEGLVISEGTAEMRVGGGGLLCRRLVAN